MRFTANSGSSFQLTKTDRDNKSRGCAGYISTGRLTSRMFKQNSNKVDNAAFGSKLASQGLLSLRAQNQSRQTAKRSETVMVCRTSRKAEIKKKLAKCLQIEQLCRTAVDTNASNSIVENIRARKALKQGTYSSFRSKNASQDYTDRGGIVTLEDNNGYRDDCDLNRGGGFLHSFGKFREKSVNKHRSKAFIQKTYRDRIPLSSIYMAPDVVSPSTEHNLSMPASHRTDMYVSELPDNQTGHHQRSSSFEEFEAKSAYVAANSPGKISERVKEEDQGTSTKQPRKKSS